MGAASGCISPLIGKLPERSRGGSAPKTLENQRQTGSVRPFNAAFCRCRAPPTRFHTLASPSRTEPEMLLRNAYVFLKECALRQTGPTSLGLGSCGGAAARPFRPGTAQDNLSATCSADSYTEPSLAGKLDV